jgi:hypothetical protein
LFNQLDLLGAAGRTPSNVSAVIDTALAIWGTRTVTSRDRALAAYILGSAYDVRSEWTRCAAWLDSALVLNPGGGGYVDLRDKCRRMGR